MLTFDRILERIVKMFTNTPTAQTMVSSHGYIVAIGQTYYDAVSSDPSNATFDCECESITYVSAHMYEEKFGTLPPSDICRETQSNQDCW